MLVLCDTNGGMLPSRLADIVGAVVAEGLRVGIHAHNDAACAVANSLAAIDVGATHVQGTANGYGERCGNADLFSVIAALEVKQGRQVLPDGRLQELGRVAHAVAEVANIAPDPHQPWVGASAFAHKAGLHVSAIKADPDLYQHTDPATVGNDIRLLISELAGRATIELKGRALGLEPDAETVLKVLDRVKELESVGYSFEAAEASFELLLREQMGERPRFFELESWRVIVEHQAGAGRLGGDREAGRRRGADHRDRGGQRAGQRPGQRAAAGAARALPGAGGVRPRRLQGADRQRRARHRRGHAGAGRDLGRHDASGARSACTRTSSRPRGRRSRRPTRPGLLRQGPSKASLRA